MHFCVKPMHIYTYFLGEFFACYIHFNSAPLTNIKISLTVKTGLRLISQPKGYVENKAKSFYKARREIADSYTEYKFFSSFTSNSIKKLNFP